MNTHHTLPRIAISVGDPNGIGYEIILKSLANKDILEVFTPVIFGSTKHLNHYKSLLNIDIPQFQGTRALDKIVPNKINVVNLWKDVPAVELGTATEASGKMAFESLQAAAEAVKNGDCDVLVTAPINKNNIQSEAFQFPGHTEYLGAVWGGDPLMFLVSESLKVSLVTQHLPLSQVAKNINAKIIQQKVKALNDSLVQDFGVRRPKIAVLGLNPHAGDGGLLGTEENDIILPSIQEINNKGTLVYGPYAADSFFSSNFSDFDAVLGMYHDQVLTPFKTICFEEGVNYTASLPFVRTSPDHGVAYDIAGKGIADETSFKEAMYTAIQIFRKRKEYKEITANVLKPHNLKLGKDQ